MTKKKSEVIKEVPMPVMETTTTSAPELHEENINDTLNVEKEIVKETNGLQLIKAGFDYIVTKPSTDETYYAGTSEQTAEIIFNRFA